MVTILIVVASTALAAQAFMGLCFFISCIWENEKRASVFAGLQFLGMLALLMLFLVLASYGFFHAGPGLFVLMVGYVASGVTPFFLLRRTEPNPMALQGTKGRIQGEVQRFDEREQVFARNRSLKPGSEQYRRFYEKHPEYEAFGARRIFSLMDDVFYGRKPKPKAPPPKWARFNGA